VSASSAPTAPTSYIVWRPSSGSERFTTYVDHTDVTHKHEFTLQQIRPVPDPTQIAETPEQFHRLAAHADERPPGWQFFINTDIAQEVLGW
jgi:hypothetical protein